MLECCIFQDMFWYIFLERYQPSKNLQQDSLQLCQTVLYYNYHISAHTVVQSNLDYSKCQGPHESFRIIGSSNDRNQVLLNIFGKASMLP